MHYFTTDHLGSTRLVTDASGNVLEQFDYLPYGERCISTYLAKMDTKENIKKPLESIFTKRHLPLE